MRISVNMQLDRIKNGLLIQQDQIPFMMATSLTSTAKDVEAAEIKEIKDSFDRPTPSTLNSIYVQAATKQKMKAVVGIKDFMGKGNPAIKFLAAQIKGGPRRMKRFELALQRAGVMPEGYAIVPGEGIPLDQYGNVSQGLIVQLISYFKAFPELGYKANMTDKRKASLAKGNVKKGRQGVVYFVARDGWLHPGIWARYTFASGSSVRPILMFVKAPTYEKRFDFYYTAEVTINNNFEKHFRSAWARTWATARR